MPTLAALHSISSPSGDAPAGRRHAPRSPRLVSCGRLEVEQVRSVEHARLAATVDRDLRAACRAESAARLELGTRARDLLRRRSYHRLAFVRLADYARERLGVSARTLEDAALVATRLMALPGIAAAFHGEELSWTQVRLLATVAGPGDEETWLRYAREHSVAELMAVIAAHRPGDAAAAGDSDDDLIDGEPPAHLRVACPSRLRSLWRWASELASRVAGETMPSWRAAEAIAAEGVAARPMGVSIGDRVLLTFLRLGRWRASIGDRATAFMGGRSAETDERASTTLDHAAAATAAGPASPLGDSPEIASPPLVSNDPFEIDARLIEALSTLRRLEPEIGRLLRVLVDHHLHRALGFRSLDRYVRARLGISIRKVWMLVKIERGVRGAPALASAYEEGRLSWVRTLTVLPVVDPSTADAWLERANTVTVRRLQDEVNWVLDRRDLHGPFASLLPPPVDSPLVQIGAHASGVGSVTKDGTFEIADGEVRFTGPASVVALFHEALEVFATPGAPRWESLERLLTRVIADWEAEPSHRDPVFARDGWRCTVPGCSSRRNLHDHHVQFRSRGGGNERTNRTTVCAAHHLHGIHAGTIRVSGAAPVLHWELPLFSCIGDRYV